MSVSLLQLDICVLYFRRLRSAKRWTEKDADRQTDTSDVFHLT